MSSETPTAAQEWRAHWPTVLAAALGFSCTTIYVYSAGALVEPIQQDTGWTRAQIGSGITVATAVGAALGPFMGAAVDRFGPRRLAIPGIPIYCAALAMLSLTGSTLPSWWALWFLLGLCGFGIKPGLWTTAVAALFSKSRGLALAVTLSGASIGSITVPIVATLLSQSFGWRYTYIGLALIWGVVVFPIVLLFFHDVQSKAKSGKQTARTALPGLAIRESMLSRRFISLAIAMILFSFLSLAFIISLIPMLSSQGIAKSTAAGLAAIVGVTAVIGRLGSGYLLDRLDARLLTTCAMALPLVTALLLLALPGSIPIAALAILILGLSLGAEIDAVAFLTGRYFGLRHYGLLFSTLISGSTIATGTAPLIAGYVFDRTGSYDALLIAMIPLSLIAAALIAQLGRPPRWDSPH